MKQPLSLSLLSPRGVLCVTIAIWFACLVAPFNSYTLAQDTDAYFVMFGFVAAFVVGTFIWKQPQPGALLPRHDSDHAYRRAFTIILMIAGIGLALRFYDLLAVKHFADYQSASDFRLAEVDEGQRSTGGLSAISLLLYPVSLVAFLLSLYLHKRLHMWQRVTALGCLAAFVGYFMMQGGRSPFAVTAIMTAAVVVLRSAVDPEMPLVGRRKFLLIAGVICGFAGFVYYSAHVMQSRLESFGVKDPVEYITVAEQARGFVVNEPYRSMLNSDSSMMASIAMTGSSMTYYFNHGFFDFSELYIGEKKHQPLGGVMQFAPIVQFLNNVGVKTTTVDEGQERIPRPGAFYTFFGNVLIDYGVIGGFIYCFCLGAFVQLLWIRARAGSILGLLLYPFFVSVIFHFPMLDMIAGGYGLFVIFGIFLSVGLIRYFGALDQIRQRRMAVLRAA